MDSVRNNSYSYIVSLHPETRSPPPLGSLEIGGGPLLSLVHSQIPVKFIPWINVVFLASVNSIFPLHFLAACC